LAGILSLLIGRRLCDRYRVDSVLGVGGMGAVCRAHDEKLEREVAVKVVTAVVADPAEQERLRARFHREARAAARLRHPNVVTVHDFGSDPSLGIDFLVMELLSGEDLVARIRRSLAPLPVREAVEILRGAARGLAAGHRAGLVHRDVKPGNVFLTSEPGGWGVKVLDFGIAQLQSEVDTDTRLTVHGTPHTPRYASPEQLRGDSAISAASDVYSLALTGLEMLRGEHPEGLNACGDDREAARLLKRLVDARREVPLGLAAVLRRGLRLDPAARFADAGEFLEALLDAEASPFEPFTTATPRSQRASSLQTREEATLYAPPTERPDLTALAGPTVAAPGPVPHRPASPQAPGKDAAARRPRGVFRVAGLSLLVAGALAVVLLASERRGGADGPSREEAVAGADDSRPDAPGGTRLAREEARRVTEAGARQGEALWVVMLGSFRAEELSRAREIRARLRERGRPVGLANTLVYPEIRGGYVALVAGPYSREEGAAALEELRAEIAPDAFLKRVTLRSP